MTRKGDFMVRFGLCCISLSLQELDPPLKFQTMTYKRFSSLDRNEALSILGDRILNNMIVTNEIIKLCAENHWCYRLSSNLMPLISYDKANVDLKDLPNNDGIQDIFDEIKETIKSTNVRISAHPDQFNVLASPDEKVVEKTITELNLMSSLMDRFGLSADHNTPINIHIQNSKDGTREEISHRFLKNFYRLDENCQRRLVVENDDRQAAWSVAKLIDIFHPITHIPITYDSHHFRLNNPENLTADDAAQSCFDTWGGSKPLFHFSNGRDHTLDKAHSDYVYDIHEELFSHEIDVDYEYKLKDQTIAKFIESYQTYANYLQPTKVAS
jgi:UV DNA damage endonuclease